MIRVMIVEDDKLARRGIVSLMPWEKFGMTVVGEAGNGAAALQMMERTGADFLITDLEMPVMSGLELIRIVRERYPSMHIAVLTLHQDFEYVREALRLGAIDYIAKTELEQESFDKVLSRMHVRISQAAGGGAAERRVYEYAVVLFCRRMGDFPSPDFIRARIPHEEVSKLSWIWMAESYSEACETADSIAGLMRDREGACVMVLSGLSDCRAQALSSMLRDYQKDTLFYDCSASCRILEKSLDALSSDTAPGKAVDMEALRLRWLFPSWVFWDGALKKLLADSKRVRVPPVQLLAAVSQAVEDLCLLTVLGEAGVSSKLQEICSFEQFETFAREFADMLRPHHYEAPPKEIVDSICYALHIIGEEFGGQLHAESIAQMVHMSRSYFFQCFKMMLGVTFNDYVRLVRMSRAKKHLYDSSMTVAWVARAVGYADEKYFSQVFRSIVGVLPKEYQKQHMAEKHGGSI